MASLDGKILAASIREKDGVEEVVLGKEITLQAGQKLVVTLSPER
jgi:hypothetical protein